MYVSILGRQPALSIAELERVFGGTNVTPLSDLAATVDTPLFEIQDLGGTLKAGKVVIDLRTGDWTKVSNKLVQHYCQAWSKSESKITLGLSVYGFNVSVREVQKIGIVLKQKLKQSGVSLRLIPNSDIALSTASSHHNKLGLSNNKVELLIVRANNGRIVVANSTGAQNITAYAKRDQERPRRDAFVGMLPPKLAQIMINLAVGRLSQSDTPLDDPTATAAPEITSLTREFQGAKGGSSNEISESDNIRVLDPFCGTGVVLQEALLMRYNVYGTDLSEKMIRYSRDNLNWLQEHLHIRGEWYLHEGDATNTKWQQPINAVVAETYLGQPFSAPPSPAKLEEVRKTCNGIITDFLRNLAPQLDSGTPVTIAVPAWHLVDGGFVHLPLISTIAQLGYKPHEFYNVSQNDLLYFREDQIVARELLVLTRV